MPPLVTIGFAQALAMLALAARAAAFVPLSLDPITSERWDAAPHAETGGAGLHDGVQVAIEPQLAETLIQATIGAGTAEDVTDLERAIRGAFAAWENPVLAFTIAFDGPVVRGTSVGQEIDVFVVPGTDPAFTTTGALAGVMFPASAHTPDRRLTNGTTLAGSAFSRTDIFLNSTNIGLFAATLFPTREQKLAALQRLLMHEIGHALGLHHPNEFVSSNLDTDGDPLNRMVLDPADPLATLAPSPAVDPDGIMSNFPADIPGALLFTALRNDEVAGRDALYPALPETICPPVPRNLCRTSRVGHFKVRVKRGLRSRTRIGWKWQRGTLTSAEVGDPRTFRTYGLCAWSGALPRPLLSLRVPPHDARWRRRRDGGFVYDDPVHAASGVARITLDPGAGRGRLELRAGGVNVPAPALEGLGFPLVVQLVDHDSTGCFDTRFDAVDVTMGANGLEAKRVGAAGTQEGK